MAVTITAVELATAIGASDDLATRLLSVATEVVTRYAPDAPDAIANEAVIRLAGWLAETPSSGVLEAQRGKRAFMLFRPTSLGALRSSGAMSLLRAYKAVGAGVIG